MRFNYTTILRRIQSEEFKVRAGLLIKKAYAGSTILVTIGGVCAMGVSGYEYVVGADTNMAEVMTQNKLYEDRIGLLEAEKASLENRNQVLEDLLTREREETSFLREQTKVQTKSINQLSKELTSNQNKSTKSWLSLGTSSIVAFISYLLSESAADVPQLSDNSGVRKD